MSRIRWLRRLIRNNTTRIPEDKAEKYSRTLSILYAVIAWNAFGFVCYNMYHGKSDWAKYYGLKSDEELALSPAQQWARTLDLKNPTIYRVSGFKVEKIEDHTEETE